MPSKSPDVASQVALTHVSCALCGAESASHVVVGRDRELDLVGRFHVVRCDRCGHSYMDPRPTDGQIDRLYPDMYHPFTRRPRREARRRQVPASIRRLLDWRTFGSHPRPRDVDVLELGCGAGNNLRRLTEDNCRVLGIEPNPRAARCAAAHGEVLTGDDRRIDELPDRRFDVVQAFMVLEHVGSPVDLLRRLRRVCVAGGEIELMVPNFDCRQRASFGADWFPLQLPRHWQHFSAASITRALTDAGWHDVEVWQQRTTVDYWKSLSLRFESRLPERIIRNLSPMVAVLDLMSLPVVELVVRARGSTRLTVRAVNPG